MGARLGFAGVRANPRRLRRVMGENGLLAPHRVGRAESKPHDGTIVTNKVNEMWGTDMTQTITVAEGRAYDAPNPHMDEACNGSRTDSKAEPATAAAYHPTFHGRRFWIFELDEPLLRALGSVG